MNYRPSNQLIGVAKDVIETCLYNLSMQIPPGFNEWDHGRAVMFKQRSQRATEMCKSGRATLKELTECYMQLEECWK